MKSNKLKAKMQKSATIVLFVFSSFCLLPSALCQTNQPAATARAVMVDSNGVVIAPINFAAVNGFGTNNGSGLSTNLPPARVYIGNTLSNASPQAIGGDLTISTNGTTTLASAGTAGTYAQVSTDSKGRVTSGTATLPVSAGGSGQTSASAALTSFGGLAINNNLTDVSSPSAALSNLNGFGLNANNTATGSNQFQGSIRLQGSVFLPIGPPQWVFDNNTNLGGDSYIELTGSPYSSGPSIAFDILGKAFQTIDTNIATNRWGYEKIDFANWCGVGDLAPYSDIPDLFLGVANQVGIGVAIAKTKGNVPLWWGIIDQTYGDHFGVPYLGATNSVGNSGTNNRIYGESVWNNSTNVVNRPADAPVLMDWDLFHATTTQFYGSFALANGVTLATTNGTIIKTNGTLNNAAAFDGTDGAEVHLNDAIIVATNFIASSHTSYTTKVGFDAAGNGSGINGEQTPNGGGVFCVMLGYNLHPAIAETTTGQSWYSATAVAIGGDELEDGRTWGNGVFDVHGSEAQNCNIYTNSLSATVTNSTILLNAATLTCTLPDATSHCTGRKYTIKLVANSTATVATTSSQKIDGATSFSLSAQYKYVAVQSDGTQWWIIANN